MARPALGNTRGPVPAPPPGIPPPGIMPPSNMMNIMNNLPPDIMNILRHIPPPAIPSSNSSIGRTIGSKHFWSIFLMPIFFYEKWGGGNQQCK
jgi:hypothetical protein